MRALRITAVSVTVLLLAPFAQASLFEDALAFGVGRMSRSGEVNDLREQNRQLTDLANPQIRAERQRARAEELARAHSYDVDRFNKNRQLLRDYLAMTLQGNNTVAVVINLKIYGLTAEDAANVVKSFATSDELEAWLATSSILGRDFKNLTKVWTELLQQHKPDVGPATETAIILRKTLSLALFSSIFQELGGKPEVIGPENALRKNIRLAINDSAHSLEDSLQEKFDAVAALNDSTKTTQLVKLYEDFWLGHMVLEHLNNKTVMGLDQVADALTKGLAKDQIEANVKKVLGENSPELAELRHLAFATDVSLKNSSALLNNRAKLKRSIVFRSILYSAGAYIMGLGTTLALGDSHVVTALADFINNLPLVSYLQSQLSDWVSGHLAPIINLDMSAVHAMRADLQTTLEQVGGVPGLESATYVGVSLAVLTKAISYVRLTANRVALAASDSKFQGAYLAQERALTDAEETINDFKKQIRQARAAATDVRCGEIIDGLGGLHEKALEGKTAAFN